MNIINLKLLLRVDFNNHIRPLVIKDKCEICNSKENLIVHHDKRFVDQLEEILNLLYIEDYDNISDEQVKQIKLMMLGSQIKTNNITLCEECHKKAHKDGFSINAKFKYKTRKKTDTDDVSLEIFNELEKFLNDAYDNKVRFDKEDFRKNINQIIEKDKALVVLLNRADGNGKARTKGMKVYNRLFNNLGLDYYIDSKARNPTINGKRKKITEWIILKNSELIQTA